MQGDATICDLISMFFGRQISKCLSTLALVGLKMVRGLGEGELVEIQQVMMFWRARG